MGIKDRDRLRLIEAEATRLKELGVGTYRVNDGPGRHGLYLQVRGPKARSWIYRFTLNGRLRELGLGSAFLVPLATAAEKADAARLLQADGIDPIKRRRDQRATERLGQARTMTFEDCGERYIAAHEPSWRNPKHRQQWRNSLATYVYPVFGSVSVQDIDTALVTKAIEPIWIKKPETASRIRGRIESILDWAKAREFRAGENPARWRGHLENLLPAHNKVRDVKHHAALPYTDIPVFMSHLRDRGSLSARALEVTILTVGRASEVLGAEWSEIDLDAAIWTVPAARMKAGKEHKVPLPARAVEILRDLYSRHEGDLVFPGQQADKALSAASMKKLLHLVGRADLTIHGFRSTFRDWAAERTNFPNEVCEMALAHTIPDKVEAAYRRGDLFEKRRRLMAAWGDYCSKQIETSAASGEVVLLRV
jgi:integrase